MFNKKNLLKILIFIPIVLFRKIDVIFSRMRFDIPVAEFFVQNMFSGNPSRQNTNLTLVMFGLFEIILFCLLFGEYIYKDLFGSGVYIIVRQKSRLKWFLRRCAELFIISILFSIVFVGINFIIGLWFSRYSIDYMAIKVLVLTLILVSLFSFWQVLMINLVAIGFGSTISFSINYIILTVLSLLAVSYEKIPIIRNFPLLLKLNPVSNVTINWFAEWGETLMPVLYFIALLALSIFIGNRVIKSIDISLKNNEKTN